MIIYQSEDGAVKVDVQMADETVWLTIDGMVNLFGKSRSTINEHILHIFEEGELSRDESVRKIGNSDFSTKPTNYRWDRLYRDTLTSPSVRPNGKKP